MTPKQERAIRKAVSQILRDMTPEQLAALMSSWGRNA